MFENSSRGCLVVVALCVGALALFTLPIGTKDKDASRSDSDSDESSMRFFVDHAADFEKLRELVELHPTLVHYHLARDVATPWEALDHQDDHRSKIRSLMKDLGISALNGPASDWGIRLIIQNEGWAMASITKSFYFSRQAPAPLVPSIEKHVIKEPESSGVYWWIAPNWYLKMDWGG